VLSAALSVGYPAAAADAAEVLLGRGRHNNRVGGGLASTLATSICKHTCKHCVEQNEHFERPTIAFLLISRDTGAASPAHRRRKEEEGSQSPSQNFQHRT